MAQDYNPFTGSGMIREMNLGGLNVRVSPLNQNEGEFIRLINVESYPIGAKRKRAGMSTLLGTPDGSAISNLFDWHQDDGTTFWLYRASGSSLYYSQQGTGAWTICGNGTITAGSFVGHTVLNNTLIVGDGIGSTRHTTNGTAFTNTPGAPIAQYFENYQNRVYIAAGTNVVYSVTGDPTNWSSTGTSDGNSFTVPGPGKLNGIMKVADRIITTKNTGLMHRWDGYNLFDLSTDRGPTSFLSIGKVDDYAIYLNRKGYFGFNGAVPQVISAAIQPQIYNDMGSAIAGGTFDRAPATVHRYHYLAAIGTVTDDLTGEQIPNCLQIYHYQLDQWYNYSMGTPITALWSYKDQNFNDQLALGDSGGQCYLLGGAVPDDNGQPIEAIMEFVFHGGLPELEKEWNWVWLFFNPGCEANAQIAVGDLFYRESLNWIDLGDVGNGVGEFHFKKERGRLLFVRITESSRQPRFSFYGISAQFTPIKRT